MTRFVPFRFPLNSDQTRFLVNRFEFADFSRPFINIDDIYKFGRGIPAISRRKERRTKGKSVGKSRRMKKLSRLISAEKLAKESVD